MIDLEEMFLRVRAPSARTDIREAIECYNAGAYRAAVVATWSAVVFDITMKFRELELAGDKNATVKVQEFENIRTRNDIRRSLEWEAKILEVARDEFELLTHQEMMDLERLREDRHRCAHSAMNTSDDPYRPPAELVRYHLRSALTHLLTQAPVQGKAAFQRLITEVGSDLFPIDTADAVEVLKAGALARPKDSLLRDFVLACLKESLDPKNTSNIKFRRRLRAALRALKTMHQAKVIGIFELNMASLLRRCGEDSLGLLFQLGHELEDVWLYMPVDVKVKMETFISGAIVAKFPRSLTKAAMRPEVAAAVIKRINEMESKELAHLAAAEPTLASKIPALVNRAVGFLMKSGSWDRSNSVIESILVPVAAGITTDDFVRIAQAAVNNVQVNSAHATPTLIRAIRDHGTIPYPDLRAIALESGLANEFPVEFGIDSEDPEGIALKKQDAPWRFSLDPETAHVGESQQMIDLMKGSCLQFTVGERVHHPRHGNGTILSRSGTYGQPSVDIQFDKVSFETLRLLCHLTELRPAPEE